MTLRLSPTTHNIAWDDFLAVLKEVAHIGESHDGAHLVAQISNDRQVFVRPDAAPVDEKTVLEARRMFKDAGFS